MMYHITNDTQIFSHSQINGLADRLFRDGDSDMDALFIEARLRSGDYFVTLATECEQLAQTLRTDGAPEADVLVRIADELHYLDQHYTLKGR